MLPVSLPTSVAIPNPSLHESQVFSPYSPFFNPHAGHPGQVPPPGPHHLPASPPGGGVDVRDSPPLPHPPSILHPALLAAAQHGSPDYGHLRMDSNDRPNDCNSDDISYDGISPTISFSNTTWRNSKIRSPRHYISLVKELEIVQKCVPRNTGAAVCAIVSELSKFPLERGYLSVCWRNNNARGISVDFDAPVISRRDRAWTFSKESTVELSILNREEHAARTAALKSWIKRRAENER